MRCPNCQSENDDRVKFCTSCGYALQGRRCAQGHSIPDGLTDCPYCPRPIRAATVAEPASPAPGAPPRQGTAVVSPDELVASGVQPGNVRPSVPPARPPGAPAARGRTEFMDPDATPTSPMVVPTARADVAPIVGFLVSFSQERSGQFWPIRFGRTAIGSDPAAEVHLPANGVSARHAAILVRDNQGVPRIYLTDTDSTNGTRLNGAEIFAERPDLANGDRIGVSAMELTVVLIPRPER